MAPPACEPSQQPAFASADEALNHFVEVQRKLALMERDWLAALPVGTPAAVPLLRDLRRSAIQAIQIRLASLVAPGGASDHELTKAAESLFKRRATGEGLGAFAGALVRRVKGHAGLLYVGVTLDLPCGSDDTMHLLRVSGGKLCRVLTAGAHNYASAHLAQFRLIHAVTPADRDGKYFVVTANLNPNCSSLWRLLEYRVLTPSSDPDTPRVLAYGKTEARLDERIWIEATKDSASIHFVGGFGNAEPQTRSLSRRGDIFEVKSP
jgi:hypothetical protein